MRKLMLAAALSATSTIAMATPASAAILFTLDNAEFFGGGTLTGTFTTNDDFTTLLGMNITASGGHNSWANYDYAATSFTLSNVNMPITGPGGIGSAQNITVNMNGEQLKLDFVTPVPINGSLLSMTSAQTQGNNHLRWLASGSVTATPIAAAVPEPATWALMIVGFGMVGAAMRRRSKTSVRFA
ncbi:MAG: PEPxxWA-CTERM sorting domain-containing protein [Sphingomonas bacterium]